LTISPIQAAGIMLPILCLMDLVGLWSWRGKWNRALMAKLLPSAIAGIVVGALLFHHLNGALVKALVGLLALFFSLNFWLNLWLNDRVRAPFHLPDRLSAWLWSGMSGFTSFVAHAGGAPMMIYLLPLRLDKTMLVGTLTVMFTAVNYVKVVPYVMLGQLSLPNLATALVLAPLAPIGVKLGIALHKKMDQALFYRLSYSLLLLTGLKLTWDGMAALLR
jgi:uncharacterized membrane protein YfcA